MLFMQLRESLINDKGHVGTDLQDATENSHIVNHEEPIKGSDENE
jgi:hypothetical protein